MNDLRTYTQDTNTKYKTRKIYLVWQKLKIITKRKEIKT